MANYSVQNHTVGTLLGWIQGGEIAIPEIQRPFVWKSKKVRELLDSLYKDYPVGYIITWKNPDVKLKNGRLSEGKKVLIDGQQRITALTAAMAGQTVLDDNYRQKRIQIAFLPKQSPDSTAKFEVYNKIIDRDKRWINDISEFFQQGTSTWQLLSKYFEVNPEADRESVEQSFSELMSIENRSVGIIELDAKLDIETVTEIFIRINSQGVVLSQSDFVMSKIAADEQHGGNLMRKAIDYFCHVYNNNSFFEAVKADESFNQSDFFKQMAWIKDHNDDIYEPAYTDVSSPTNQNT